MTRARAAALAVGAALSLLATAATCDEIPLARAPGLLPGPPAPFFQRAFDVLASDFDLDGDQDLLINWHHTHPLELLENRSGHFVRIPVQASGLFANRVGPIHASEAEMASGDAPAPALTLWHEPNRGGRWYFRWSAGAGAGDLRLSLTTSLRFLDHDGLAPEEVRSIGPRRLELSLSGSPRAFSVWPLRPASELRVEVAPRADGGVAPLRIGPQRALVPSGSVALWQPDPHGIAWLDVEGSPHPELYLTRGALAGELHPPAHPKEERYYVHGGDSDPPLYARAAPGVVPPDYGRGRRVEWVDVTGDRRPELAVARRDGAAALLVRTESGFEDRAAGLGLEAFGGVQTWGDLDGDGRDDCFTLTPNGIDVLRRSQDGFERRDAASLGLVLPQSSDPSAVVAPTALRLADLDSDGDLDLLVLGRGDAGRVHVFRREGATFVDATGMLGLADTAGVRVGVVLDVDADADLDLLLFGDTPALWRREPDGFVRRPLPHALVPGRVDAATVADVDGDGRPDVVVVARRAHVLLGLTERPPLAVEIGDTGGTAIGTLVMAEYADGRRLLRRYGSDRSSAFSQSLGPLHFAHAGNARVVALNVRWPGASTWTRTTVSAEARQLRLER